MSHGGCGGKECPQHCVIYGIKGPPERQNLNAEAMIFLQVVATHCVSTFAISHLLALLRTLSSHFSIAGHFWCREILQTSPMVVMKGDLASGQTSRL
ncbi:hypothetical protein KY284_002711 [Solanum tuberosum]|nr:hypothetical protein KY284_002711 [Solanum tuberosum]